MSRSKFVLWTQDKPEPVLVKMHDIQQGLSGAVMEVWRAGGEAAEDWPLDLAGAGAAALEAGNREIWRHWDRQLPNNPFVLRKLAAVE